MQIISIDKDDFEEAINGSDNTLMAQHDFREMAICHELLIYDRDRHENLMIMVPPNVNIDSTDQPITAFYRRVLVSYAEVAKYLRVSESDARSYLCKIRIDRIAILNEISNDGIYSQEDFDEKMKVLSAQDGISPEKAQLLLGITKESFEIVRKYIRYHETNNFLPPLVNGLFRAYLRPRTTYTTRKAAVEDFVDNFNNAHSGTPIEPQYCDACAPDNACPASDKCSVCEKYLCPKHAHWVDSDKVTILAPEKICDECLAKKDLHHD